MRRVVDLLLLPRARQSTAPSVLKPLQFAAAVSVALICAGCATIETPESSAPPPLEEKYVSTNEPAVLGRKHFERGHYGLSERYFREAVERDPRDLDSWIGLAASYDNLKRFDLADRAYQQALRLGGPSAPVLNNMGYSYMLRGDFRKAKATLQRALKLDPTNVVVLNNIRLLEGAQKPMPRPRT